MGSNYHKIFTGQLGHDYSGSERMGWNEYWFTIARVVSTRATCPRKQVGCVIVADNRILATGYNGSEPGEPHCTEVAAIFAPTTVSEQYTQKSMPLSSIYNQYYLSG